MQKDVAKVVMAAAGVPVPEGRVVSRLEAAKDHADAAALCHQADRRRLQRRRFIVTEQHEHPPQELTRDGWTFGERFWSSDSSPARS